MYINDISQDIPQIFLKHIGSHDVFRGEEIFKFVDVLNNWFDLQIDRSKSCHVVREIIIIKKPY